MFGSPGSASLLHYVKDRSARAAKRRLDDDVAAFQVGADRHLQQASERQRDALLLQSHPTRPTGRLDRETKALHPSVKFARIRSCGLCFETLSGKEIHRRSDENNIRQRVHGDAQKLTHRGTVIAIAFMLTLT